MPCMTFAIPSFLGTGENNAVNLPKEGSSDGDLARQARDGSMRCFEELVYRYEARLFRFLFHATRNEADAVDLTQETFVAVHRHLHRFDPDRSFATWIFTIARRKLIDHLRTLPREAGEVLPETADEADPSHLLSAREDQQEIWKLASAALTPVQFQALWLRYVDELSIGQIAQVLRRTNAHIKVILFRARSALAAELKSRTAVDTDRGSIGTRTSASSSGKGNKS